jgi:predicted O-methyltransferase YrrM
VRLWRGIFRRLTELHGQWFPNWRGVHRFPPGHFYSPLLDIAAAGSIDHDDASLWEHIDLRLAGQLALVSEILDQGPIEFPAQQQDSHRYWHENGWFPFADAFWLSGIVTKVRPRRIVEVGSGYSTAALLDTLDHIKLAPEIILIEPDPVRLAALLRKTDVGRYTLRQEIVQKVPLDVFDQLESGDVLFIDSSHVAKAGSDVSHLFLRVLPRLKAGVWVHVHDITYPETLPPDWVEEGRAWNESLFLRAFVMQNAKVQVRAFHAFARQVFPAVAWGGLPALAVNTGSSFWMQTCEAR